MGAKLRVGLGEGRQAVKKGAEIEAGAAGEDGEALAGGDFGDYGSGLGLIFAGGVTGNRISHVKQPMRNCAPLGRGCFGRTDVKPLIDLK